MGPEWALIARTPALNVLTVAISPAQFAFFTALDAGQGFAAATRAATDLEAGFDPAVALSLLFGAGLVIHAEAGGLK